MSDIRTQITSRSDFHTALRSGFEQAAALGCRELWLCDSDFADWPLGERGVIAHLGAWAGSQRRMTVLAHSFDTVARQHARWVEWRRQWSHLVECRTNPDVEAARMPCLLLAPGALRVHLSDPVHYRGSLSQAPADLVQAKESIDAVLQRSVHAFPATTTGL